MPLTCIENFDVVPAVSASSRFGCTRAEPDAILCLDAVVVMICRRSLAVQCQCLRMEERTPR